MSGFWLYLAVGGFCLAVLAVLAFFSGVCVHFWRAGERLGGACILALVTGMLAFAVGAAARSGWEALP